MKVFSVESLSELINRHGLDNYFRDLMQRLQHDFSRWQEFTKTPRSSMKVPNGFIELMPIHDNKHHMYKYVTCYPDNPLSEKQTVLATGQLSLVETGYPLIISEMTVSTALRTAATAALVTDLMSRNNSNILTIIGTGAQSEFQVKATAIVRDIKEVRYFDIDHKAMDKFEQNLRDSAFKLVRCDSIQQALEGADIITVCTACMGHAEVIKDAWIKPGVHINALGGDCPGKTELELSILTHSRLITDYFDQAATEGEIQRLSKTDAEKYVYGELYELTNGTKVGRESDDEITLYDSVGMALEDYSALMLSHELGEKYNIGEERNLTPTSSNPKDLISVLL